MKKKKKKKVIDDSKYWCVFFPSYFLSYWKLWFVLHLALILILRKQVMRHVRGMSHQMNDVIYKGQLGKYQLSFSILQKHLIFLVRKNLSNHIWNCSRLNIPDLQHGNKWSLILYNLVGNGWFLIYLNRSKIGFNQIQIIQLEIVAV